MPFTINKNNTAKTVTFPSSTKNYLIIIITVEQ